MFSGCSSLISLNITGFSMSRVEDMIAMFSGCSSLTSLDLSNFETNKKPHMDSMFKNCINLEYINLKKLRFPDKYDCTRNDNMFDNVKKI
jgi:surface protein